MFRTELPSTSITRSCGSLKKRRRVVHSGSMDERARAIEEVYRARYASFRNAIAALTGSPQVAHDAVQEAFAEALAQKAHFRGGSWEAWIWVVALRTARR